MTWADKIRQMDDEQLACFLAEFANGVTGEMLSSIIRMRRVEEYCGEDSMFVDFLKSEVDEG